MKIRRSPIEFHNVLSAKSRCSHDEWMESARDLRNAVIRNGLYGTGPIIYQISNEEKDVADYSIYLPVSHSVKLKSHDVFHFDEVWRFEDTLIYRHADIADDIEQSYELLRACAEAYELKLQEPFYHIYIDVYGDTILDIFAPVEGAPL